MPRDRKPRRGTGKKPQGPAMLRALVKALPEMKRHGVRRVTVGDLTLELDLAAEPDAPPRSDRQQRAQPRLPPTPGPGESDDLDTAAVD